jgi:hypothetical protein
MSKSHHRSTAQSLLSIDDSRITENVLQYVSEIIDAQQTLANIQGDLTDINLSVTGYETQQKLSKINRRYQKVSRSTNTLYTVMVTRNIDALDTISGSDGRDKNILDMCIRNNDIPNEIARLENSVASVGQQINSKTIAANSRLGITISLVASGIALLSIIVSLIT